MNVVLSDEAEADLEQIGDYIARDNPARAGTFLDELEESCRELGHMPLAYPLLPRYERFGIRRRVHGNYLIFYRVERDAVICHAHPARSDELCGRSLSKLNGFDHRPASASRIMRSQRSAMKSSSRRTLGSCSFLCG